MGFFKSKSKDDSSSFEDDHPRGNYVAPAPVTTAPAPAPVSTSYGAPEPAPSTPGRPPVAPISTMPTTPGGASQATGAPMTPGTPGANYDSAYESAGETDNEEHHVPDGEELDEELEWDEGGPSQCGYSEPVHNLLMSAGAAVHKIVGDPSDGMNTTMRRIGNFFQEASYAVRDVVRGDKEMKADAHAAWKEMVGGEGEGGLTDHEDGGMMSDGEADKENGPIGGGLSGSTGLASPAASSVAYTQA